VKSHYTDDSSRAFSSEYNNPDGEDEKQRARLNGLAFEVLQEVDASTGSVAHTCRRFGLSS
jgi:hypothetical protein